MNISIFGFHLVIQLLSLSAHPMVWELCFLRLTLGIMGDDDTPDKVWSRSLLDIAWEAPAYCEDGTLLWRSSAKVEALFIPLYKCDGKEEDDTQPEPLN